MMKILYVLERWDIWFQVQPEDIHSTIKNFVTGNGYLIMAISRRRKEKYSLSVKGNFFELGGHSLIIPVLIYNISKELNITFHCNILYQHQSIRMLSKYISEELMLEIVDEQI